MGDARLGGLGPEGDRNGARHWWEMGTREQLSSYFGLLSHTLTFITEKLRRQLKETQRAAFAEGTHKNLLTQWKAFLVFCDQYQYQAMPVSTDMICLYAQYLANKLKSPQTVRKYVNGVRVLQVLVDQPIEAFRLQDMRLTFRGLARLRQHQPKRAQAITPEMLCRMHRFLDSSNALDLVVWAAILVAFFCMLRESNYVPESQKSFDKSKQLCREDIAVGPDCLLVHIKWSKTIQLAKRTLHIPILAIPNSPICPVHAFQQMVDRVPAGPDNPAFCVQTKQGLRPLTYRVFQARLKQLVHKSGWVAAAFSSHPLRRGGASLAYKAKVPGELIKVQGDWASDAYLAYLSIPLEQRIQVATQLSEAAARKGGKGGKR